jgi:DNA-binding transcriptional LysR family regulator
MATLDVQSPIPETDARGACWAIELRLLECFVVVAEELHFGRAARRLGIAQPGLTRALQTLERRLGMQLLGRDSRSVTLTEAGQSMLEASREVLSQHRELMGRAELLRRCTTQSLAIAADGAFAGVLLANVVREFRTEHPAYATRLETLAHGVGAADALQGGAHLVLGAGTVKAPGLRSQELLSTERMLVVSRAHRLARHERLDPGALVHERLLTPRRAGAAWLSDWLPQDCSPAVDGRGGDFDSFDEGLELAAAGFGALVAPALARARHPRSDLAWIALDRLAPVAVHLTWRTDRESAAVTAFVAASANLARLHVRDGGLGTARSREPWRPRPAIAAVAG